MYTDPSGLFSSMNDFDLSNSSVMLPQSQLNFMINNQTDKFMRAPMANLPAYGTKTGSNQNLLAMGNCGTPGGPCGPQPGAPSNTQVLQAFGTFMQVSAMVPTPASPFLFFGGDIVSGIGTLLDDTKSPIRKAVDIALPYGAGRAAKGALRDTEVSEHVSDVFGTTWGIATEKMIGVVNEDFHQQAPQCIQQYVCR